MAIRGDEIFYDPHCHAMTLDHPNIILFLQELRKNFADEVLTELFSPTYLLDLRVEHPLSKARNMFAVLEHDISGIFMLMEDDLKGRFITDRQLREKPLRRPLLEHGVLRFRGKEYRQLVLTPLIMDFSDPRQELNRIYYSHSPKKPLWKNVHDVLEGIKRYHRERPDGFLHIYPFLGINTRSCTAEELEELLRKYFSVFTSSFTLRTETTKLIKGFSGFMDAVGSNVFSGIKVYPPLGFDPWPLEEPAELEKVKLLYTFCQKRRIPITTHCDDQGFRTIPVETAWRNSSPDRWALVLEAFPGLKLNFAHFGYQYYLKFRLIRKLDWMRSIMRLMVRHDQVYADFSFNGTKPAYYSFLRKQLTVLPEEGREKVLSRILFGTDFPVNLTKISSYLDYYLGFEASSFDDETVHRFCSVNPRNFLFTGDGPLDRVRNFFGQP